MSVDRVSKVGELVLKELPAKYKQDTILLDLIKAIPDIYDVSIPSKVKSLGFVVASQNAPDNGEAVLWIQLNGAGVPLSLRYFLDGQWRAIFHNLRSPQWFKEDYLENQSSREKEGFVLADGRNGGTDISHLFVKTSSDPINYSVYAMYFVGNQILPNP